MKWVGLLASWIIAGCAVMQAGMGKSGTDVSGVEPGITRTEVETLTGHSLRSWTPSGGARFEIYGFDAGYAPDPDQARQILLLDLLSLGALELTPYTHKPGSKVTQHLIIVYDDDDIVQGVFDWLEPLPLDGQRTRR